MPVNSPGDIPRALQSLDKACFVALDFEFPCAEPNRVEAASGIEAVYAKYARDYEGVFPCQMGLTIARQAEKVEPTSEAAGEVTLPASSGDSERVRACQEIQCPEALSGRYVNEDLAGSNGGTLDSTFCCPFERPETVDSPSLSVISEALPFVPGTQLEYDSFCFSTLPSGRFFCNYRTVKFLQHTGFSFDEWIRTAVVFRSVKEGKELEQEMIRLCEELYAVFLQGFPLESEGDGDDGEGASAEVTGPTEIAGIKMVPEKVGQTHPSAPADPTSSEKQEPHQGNHEFDVAKHTSFLTMITTMTEKIIGLLWNPETQSFRDPALPDEQPPELRDIATYTFNKQSTLFAAAENIAKLYRDHVSSLDLPEELRAVMLRLVPYFTPTLDGQADGKYSVAISLSPSHLATRAHIDSIISSLRFEIYGVSMLFEKIRSLKLPVVFFAGLGDAFVLLNTLCFGGHPPDTVDEFLAGLRFHLPYFVDLKLLIDFPPVANLLAAQHKPRGQSLGALFKMTKTDASTFSLCGLEHGHDEGGSVGEQGPDQAEGGHTECKEHNAGYDSYITAVLYHWLVSRLVLPCIDDRSSGNGSVAEGEDVVDESGQQAHSDEKPSKKRKKQRTKTTGTGQPKKSPGLCLQAIADAMHACSNRFYIFANLNVLEAHPERALFVSVGLFAQNRKVYDMIKPLRAFLHVLEDDAPQSETPSGPGKHALPRHYISLAPSGGRLMLRKTGITPVIIKLIRMNGLFATLQSPGDPPVLRFSPILRRRLEKYVDFSLGYPLTLDCAERLICASQRK